MNRKPPQILKVIDVDGDERFKDIHPNLPGMPSLCILVGSIKSGKSNLVVNFFLGKDFYWNKKEDKSIFDTVRVMSTTLHMDNKMKLMDEFYECDDHYEDKFIDDIIKSQGQFEKDDPNRPKYALVLDDILTPEFIKRSNKLSFFSSKMRHYIDFMLISTQSLNHIPPLIRAQVRDLIITKQQNHKEVIKLMEQFGGMLGDNGEKKFLELYNQVHNNKSYQVMYMKLSENPIQIFENFEKRIF